MDERRDNRKGGIAHLYQVCGIPRVRLYYWLEMDEFVDLISKIDPTYQSITKTDVLSVVNKIYNDKVSNPSPDFSLPRARRTIRALERSIQEDSDSPV